MAPRFGINRINWENPSVRYAAAIGLFQSLLPEMVNRFEFGTEPHEFEPERVREIEAWLFEHGLVVTFRRLGILERNADGRPQLLIDLAVLEIMTKPGLC